MQKTSLTKRITSFMLALLMMLNTLASACLVFAADDYYIRFYDTAIKTTSKNQTLVEGASINIEAKLPTDYSFSVIPFAIRESISGVSTPVADISTIFQIVTNTEGTSYTLVPKNLADGTDAAEYTLEALYIANIKEGFASVTASADADGKVSNFSFEVESTADIPITADSTITFNVSSDQTQEEYISFGNVTNATGYFSDKYEDQAVYSNAIQGSGNSKYIPVMIRPKTGSDDPSVLNLKIYLKGLPAGYMFSKDTTFRLSFTRQTISPLIATVISREKAVNDTRDSVLENTTATGVTTTGEAYIQLEKGETLESIQNSFAVLSQVHRYNADITLSWEWKADNPLYQEYVQIQRTSASPKQQAVTIIDRPEEDMTGKLLVKASYTNSLGSAESTQGAIPVIFYGTGNPPTVTPMKTYTGVQNGDDIVASIGSFSQTTRMDVYAGTPAYAVSGLTAPTAPYKISASIFFGDGRGRAERAVITQNSSGGEVAVYVEGSAVPYTFGDDISNIGNYKAIDIIAAKQGQTNLTFKFYNSSNELMSSYTVSQNFYVDDTTPSGDGTLSALTLKGVPSNDKKEVFNNVYPNGVIDYGFSSDVNAYTITVPYCVEKIKLAPTLTVGTGANREIKFISNNLFDSDFTVNSGDESAELALTLTQTSYSVRVVVTAQDGSTNSYTLTITRAAQSSDSSLSSFEAYNTEDTEKNLIEGFSSSTLDYTITVPYSVEYIEMSAVPNSPWVTMTDGQTVVWSGPEKKLSLAEKIMNFFTKAQTNATFKLNRPVAVDGVYPKNETTSITATVTAEDGRSKTVYSLTVISLAPSTDTSLQSLSVSIDGTTALPFEYGTTFNPDLKDYLVTIPYSSKTLYLTAQAADDENSIEMALDAAGYSYTRIPTEYKPNIPTVYTIKNMGPVKFEEGAADPNLTPFVLSLAVTAESKDVTKPPYTVEVQRNDPSDDSRLKSLTLTDQDGTAISNFSFNMEQLEYDVLVPYLTSQVVATPVANYSLSTVVINGKDISTTKPSFTSSVLVAGETYTFTIVVTAEDFSSRTYKINVKRENPSTEARLASLTTSVPELDPRFSPNTLKYKLTIPEGTKGLTVVPTAVSEYATITVNDISIDSGSTSQTINPLEEESKVYIVVTAQDGRTKNTYVINVTDENLIKKSDNADLYSLAFITGNLNPPFRPSITDYEVYVKEDVYSVEIIPKRANRYATLTVSSDSREIGDYEENYEISLFDDETEVTIEVVSQDKAVTKEYVINVYRGDEEKQGIYNPITAEEVNFTVADPIIIDIAKYPLVAADVFNTLKTDYPDKSILFTGNDYTLSIKGSDMETLVPNTEYFDLSITFSPPNEDEIWEKIADMDSDNEYLDPVYVHFNHHGTLPAPMKLTISLGSVYRNKELFWNYYNEERDRIDYYGYVVSNAKGTFSLPLTHMSTYIVTIYKIIDAEDKVGGLVGYFSTGKPESLTSFFTANKANPNTGSGVK